MLIWNGRTWISRMAVRLPAVYEILLNSTVPINSLRRYFAEALHAKRQSNQITDAKLVEEDLCRDDDHTLFNSAHVRQAE